MRFEQLRLRVEQAERQVAASSDRAEDSRHAFGEAWRRGWSPGRIVVAGLVAGFLVGRAEPLSKVGGARGVQMLGTVSTMLASLRAAAASEQAGESADRVGAETRSAGFVASTTDHAIRRGKPPFAPRSQSPYPCRYGWRSREIPRGSLHAPGRYRGTRTRRWRHRLRSGHVAARV